MNPESFEQKLARQPLRQLPVEWRADILSSAQAFSRPRPSTLDSRRTGWLSTLLWPCPQAWAGLAAVWLVILGANFATREPPTMTARAMTPPSAQVRELLKQQEQLLAELVGPMEKPKADRPRPLPPQPRSQYREEFQNA